MVGKSITCCPSCGNVIKPGAVYCIKCGARLSAEEDGPVTPPYGKNGQKICESCGKPLKGEVNFCGNCGTEVPKPPPFKEIRKCYNCGGDVENGMRFCSACGIEFLSERPPDVACLKCGEILPAETAYCTNCGYKLSTESIGEKRTVAPERVRDFMEEGIRGIGRATTIFIASPIFISMLAAVLLFLSTAMIWSTGSFSNPYYPKHTLPVLLILFTYVIAILAVFLASLRRPVWALFPILGIFTFCIEFFYLSMFQNSASFNLYDTFEHLQCVAAGFKLHFIAGIILVLNTYFAHLRQRLDFESYIRNQGDLAK